ncbi:MAG: hypothetical protein GWN99_11600 [Gemmatimonadetes bacterium]|nr:hypothetical protein [Gemmatimonadota bacterium]
MDIIGIASFVVVFGAVARWFQLAWRVDLPEDPVVFRVLVAIGVILGLTSFASGTGSALAPWAIGLGLFYLYLSFTGGQRSAASHVEVGDAIPAFSAPDHNDETFDSASLSGSPVLIKFFRGHW